MVEKSCEDIQGRQPGGQAEEGSEETKLADTLILDYQAPKLLENGFLLFQ